MKTNSPVAPLWFARASAAGSRAVDGQPIERTTLPSSIAAISARSSSDRTNIEYTPDHGPRVVTCEAPHTPEIVANALRIPVIAEIEPRPDAQLGHTFQWPPEVAQFLSLNGK